MTDKKTEKTSSSTPENLSPEISSEKSDADNGGTESTSSANTPPKISASKQADEKSLSSEKDTDQNTSTNTANTTTNTTTKVKPAQVNATKLMAQAKAAARDKEQPSEAPQNSTAKTTETTARAARTTSRAKPQTSTNLAKAPVSKLALVALLVALAAIAANGYLFWFNQQQQQSFQQQLLSQNKQQQQANAKQLQQKLSQQKAEFTRQLSQYQRQLTSQKQDSLQADERIQYLERSIARLSENKPSDWLIHEAEYLIRVAARTIWLKQDTHAAINLLKDADQRLTELNHPQFLPIRQLILDDITALQLMPSLATEEVVMTLASLHQKIDQLTLAMAKIPEPTQAEENLTLSSDYNNWRENLAKTWKKTLSYFITVRRRTGTTEPLMSPQYQQHLRENLALKIQQAQWAAREQKNELYQSTLNDIIIWLTEYYDMTKTNSQNFVQAVTQLKGATISFAYPSTLSSLDAMRAQIRQLSLPEKTEPVAKQTAPEKNNKAEQPKATPQKPQKKHPAKKIPQPKTTQPTSGNSSTTINEA